MNATEPLTEEAALWASIDAMPGDQLRRLVLADWYDERASNVECKRCNGSGKAPIGYCDAFMYGCDEIGFDDCDHKKRLVWCPVCKEGIGFIPNGYAGTAAALRATVDRVPCPVPNGICSWLLHVQQIGQPYTIGHAVFGELSGAYPEEFPSWRDYTTAADAIRDLCRAWVKVHREGTA